MNIIYLSGINIKSNNIFKLQFILHYIMNLTIFFVLLCGLYASLCLEKERKMISWNKTKYIIQQNKLYFKYIQSTVF